MMYNGDTDLACPALGNERWLNKLGLKVKSPWE